MSTINKPLNVLHLLGTAQPEGSGIAKIVASLAQGLDPQKYRLHAWFLKSDGPLVAELGKAGAVARSVTWNRGIRDPVGALRFWRHLRSEEFALVHQHWGERSIRHLIRSGSEAKIIVHSHGQILENSEGNRPPVAVRGTDAIVAVSKSVAQQFPAQQVHVVYSGISRSDRIPRMISSRKDTVVIGTACRLVEAKGVRDLILAFAALSKEVRFLQLEIAGAGPEEGALLKAAQDHGVANNVRFLGWRADLRQVLGTWDIFVLPSYDEGLPIAVLEAMAEGLPVVATNVGGVPELVDHGQTGFLVKPGDVTALHSALHGLVTSLELRNQFGNAALIRAQKDFSIGKMVAEIESIYDSLAGEKIGAPSRQ